MGRHHNIRPKDRLCKLCLLCNVMAIEDEVHVLFHCSSYKDIRSLYSSSEPSNLYDFVSWMNSNNHDHIVNLANFVYSIFKIRKQLLDEL